jgi:hypothetical protein
MPIRLSDLLRSRVVDRDGLDLGTVEDVRLVQDGPLLDGFGAALRLDALIVGHGASVRLGFHRHQVQGPWPLKRLFVALERRAHYVDWKREVDKWNGGVVLLRVAKDDLRSMADVY